MSRRFNSDRNPIHLERNGQTSPTPLRGPTWAGKGSSEREREAGDESSENRDKGTKLMMIFSLSFFFLFFLCFFFAVALQSFCSLFC